MLPIYFATEFHSSAAGSRVVGTKCEKCACEYFFELSRVGLGHGTAHYFLGKNSAAGRAEQRAADNLEELLKTEVELVPCPMCNWINEHFVHGCLMSAMGFLLVSILRRRIDPNFRFPSRPELPLGTPDALVYDPTKRELVPAVNTQGMTSGDTTHYDFSFSRDLLPDLCCLCLKPDRCLQQHPVNTLSHNVLMVPLCSKCFRDSLTRKRIVGVTVGLAIFACVFLATYFAKLQQEEFWILSCTFAVVSCFIGAGVSYFVARPARVIAVDFNRGILRLEFSNPEFQSQIIRKPLTLPQRSS